MGDSKLFDHYGFRARLLPALLTLLPAAIAILVWTGPGNKWESALWAIFTAVGGTFFLGTLARNRGKEIEPDLWASWGGSPTLQLLRHQGNGNAVLRERWHKGLSRLVGKPFPTTAEEASNPQAADELYIAGTKLLINSTRNTTKFHLLYKENVQYGYCRNLLGMKVIGLPLSLLGFVSCLAAGIRATHQGGQQVYSWVCLGIELMFSVWWLLGVNPCWVKVPANGYAERLMESIENIPRTKTPGAEKKV